MGLCVHVKGIKDINFSYFGYLTLRLLIIETAYGKECARIFMKDSLSEDDAAHWNAVHNPDLDVFLFHPEDSEGKFTPKECRKIYKALKPIHLKDEDNEEWLERLKGAFKHCAKKRVNMYYL